MHEGDRHAALADGRCDALDRAVADVAAREDPRNARLEQVRVALEGPASSRRHVGAGEDVALRVERDLRAGASAVSASAPMKMKSPPDSSAGRLARRRARDVDRLERRGRRALRPPRCTGAPRCSASSRAGRPGSSTCSSRAPRPGRGSSRSVRAREEHRRLPGRVSARRRCGRRGRACSVPRSVTRRRRRPCRRAGRTPRSEAAAT